ncbi:MAG TPA: hypothetical protein VL463_16490 [Kofleriaceae bacterium]|nr:hypothetical protein [Kofleriaceae bacterium]
MRIAIVIVVAASAACGSKRDAQAPPPPATIVIDAKAELPPEELPPPPIDAHEVPFAHDPSAATRSLGAALDHFDPADQASVDTGLEALVDWAGSGSPLHIDCNAIEATAMLASMKLSDAALANATAIGDPDIHAIARLGQALRAADNDPLAIGTGVHLARSIAEWAKRVHVSAKAALGDAAVEPDVLFRVARADLRCHRLAMQTLAAELAKDPGKRDDLAGARKELGLPVSDDVVGDELAAYGAFLDGTAQAIDSAKSDRALLDALDARIDASAKAGALTRIAAPYAAKMIARELDQYRAAL